MDTIFINELPIVNPIEHTIVKKNARLIRFEKDFKEVDLARYYQLKNTCHEKIEIDKTVQESCILLTISYKKTIPCPKFPIPDELNQLIQEYLFYSIEIKTKIEYSRNYPFTPPQWYIKGVIHNIPRKEYGLFYLLDYYIDKINNHNNKYNLQLLEGYTQWIPAISVEGDILIFLQKIINFDELLMI